MDKIRAKLSNLSWLQIVVKACLLIISISYFYIGAIRLFVGTPDLSQYIDNTMRFYAGGFIAIGILAIWTVITIRLQNIIVFFFAFFVFMTGLGRLVSIIVVGLPNNTYLFYLVIELLIPLLMSFAQVKSNKK
jgi:hypothetical protein